MILKKYSNLIFYSLLVLALIFIVSDASAANLAKQGLPIEDPLEKLMQSITGPVATTISIIAFVSTILMLALANEQLGSITRGLVVTIMLMSLAGAGVNVYEYASGKSALINSVGHTSHILKKELEGLM